MPRPRMFRLGKTGLARVLGDLEAQVMEVIWASQSPLSVQEVCDSLSAQSNYKTIMTVLSRLVDKDLLERQKLGRAYLYMPAVSKEDFLKSVADSIVNGLINDYREVAVSSFINAMESASPETLNMLEEFLKQRQSQNSDSRSEEQSKA